MLSVIFAVKFLYFLFKAIIVFANCAAVLPERPLYKISQRDASSFISSVN